MDGFVNTIVSARFLRRSSGALGVLVLAQSATAQVCFEAIGATYVGNSSLDAATADLDGDGDTDMVTVDPIDNAVSVLLNRGDGTFAPYAWYTTGDFPYRVTSADLDGDGDVDLAVAIISSSSAAVFLNNGNGTFGAYVYYPVGLHPTGITSADFDGDGDIDVATSNEDSNTVSVLINQGQGSFALHLEYAAGIDPYSVTSADLDGDGDVDLAVANLIARKVSVLMNLGNGTFAAPVSHDVGGAAYDITIADLNGDGLADLVAANYSQDSVTVFLNQGGGAFASQVKYPVLDSPHRVVAADLDEDGDLDVAAVRYWTGTVSLLLNRGNGTFAPHQDLGAGNHYSLPITHADFDGDGDDELAVANMGVQTITVYRNCLEQGIGFCFGDGSLLTSCPCASPNTVPTPTGATAHGCANSLNFAGAGLVAVGEVAPAPGTLKFRARIAPNYSDFAFLVKGDANVTSGIAAGDGIRCVGGALVRFGAHNAGTNGALLGNWTYPNSVQTTPVSIVTAQAAGVIAHYQLLYRDAAANFCNLATVNWSNGYRVTWPP